MTERRSDVLVVGGGVLGLGHAIAAVRAGLRVTLCERHTAARGACWKKLRQRPRCLPWNC